MSKKLAFIGLGVMGYPMAGHLQKAGHQVTVYNRTTAKAEDWCATYGGDMAATPRKAAADADLVFACVGNDDDVRSIVFGDDGAYMGMKPGAIFVDHTTASASLARELHKAATEKGFLFLDAPVSGGQAGAENGALTVMIGGDKNAYDLAEPVMDCYARKMKYLGDAGNGQIAKMANQICIAGVVQGLSEALHFLQAADMDGAEVIDAISKGAAQSWQMENRYETMLKGEFDYGFAVDWMRKDLGIVLDEARNNGASLPLTALVDQFYAEVQDMGGGRWDTSSLIARLNRNK
ncbi:NAD(P)-dependent oxidoreductase [Emcibacter nanhaiensis]|uniref:NAD(P)-dependent oxidoreductase n=1 Tax=Emcibacter nanhaiensis TaxID=1505037 RepID=A0A501PLY6_9PROT|nr:NAD(P)-dependent oxidoreductase [Emcibacter nanhaiensis]TPD61520.1 NAD(P)-dependent oxidoreductase [Emcibacter nanhaiensis]